MSAASPLSLPPPDPATWTAVAALWGRAVEQSAERPLIHDAAAAHWLAALDVDTHRLAGATATRVAVCARARCIDRWLGEWTKDHADGVAVELGVGFSTRALRCAALPAEFVGVDRREIAVPRDALLNRTPSLTPRPTLIADVSRDNFAPSLRDLAGTRPACFIAEGLLMFLPPATVQQLLAQLADHFPGAAFFFDAYVPPARQLQRFHDSLRRLGEPLRSTFKSSPHLQLHESQTLLNTPNAFARLPRVYRLPGVHRLHATHRATLR